ncbi:hypothetical protein C2G38_2091959 [Gigaspora rosea]|uniref:Conserved Oligomeric Golgi complex subunit 6 C-terminal domain-containing protein n=1 Tax=Gigaspora rosea TaxID=44941 RepID=A0A397V208_9GLOM|nr:hypothetical protein C2G38_2091959 [Gigaspora rosea]
MRIDNCRKSCKIRKILIDAFLEKFTLSEKEVATLSSPDAGNNDCDALLITKNQRARNYVKNSYQETAFDKLYRWIQAESRSLVRDTQEIPVTLKLALKILKQRPVLFK